MRTDGTEDLLTISDAFTSEGIRLQINTCMQTLIPISSNYFSPIIIDIEEEERKAEIVKLNDRLSRLWNNE